MVLVCKNCGSSDTDTDPTRGDVVCMNCGAVLEKQLIANEVQFEDNAVGGSSLIGQFVTADGRIAGGASGIGAGLHFGTGRESTEQTIAKARRRIQLLATQLGGLHRRQIDQAVEFFKMALKKEFTKGRPVMQMAAACLYLVCRVEGTSHMLLDLCDQIEADIFVLGQVYLQLTKVLQVQTRVMEPALYVHRFAMRLELGERAHEVEMVALRLVQRMTRDWLATGRRPAGLCAASLLVAARLCGFNRSAEDLARVARICRATLKRRLVEFEQTETSRLSVQEFKQVDLEHTHDPPAFTAGFDKNKQSQARGADKSKTKNASAIAGLNEAGINEAVIEVKSLKERIEKEMERLSRLSEHAVPRAHDLLGVGMEQLGLSDLRTEVTESEQHLGAQTGLETENDKAEAGSTRRELLDTSTSSAEANLVSFLLGETHRETLDTEELEGIEDIVLQNEDHEYLAAASSVGAVAGAYSHEVQVQPSTSNLVELAPPVEQTPMIGSNVETALDDDDIDDDMNLPAAEIILRFAREQKAARMASEPILEDDARSTVSTFAGELERGNQSRSAGEACIGLHPQLLASGSVVKIEDAGALPRPVLLPVDEEYDYGDIDRDIEESGYIISDTSELEVRSAEWHAANAIYLREQAEKERERELERAARRNDTLHEHDGADADDQRADGDSHSVTSGTPRRAEATQKRGGEVQRRKRRKRVDFVLDVAEKMLRGGEQPAQTQPRIVTRKKAASNKINYDVLKQINASSSLSG